RNFFVDYRSGASTRPGTEFVRPCTNGINTPVRLVRFQQSVGVTYVLEFGQNYLRFISNGGFIVEPAFSITGITESASSTTFFASGHDFSAGDIVFVFESSVPQANSRYFIVSSVSPGVSFVALDGLTGVFVDSSAWAPWTGGG